MTSLPFSFLQKIAHMLQEEEIDIYTLTLYCMNSDDMNYFPEKDREAVKRIFKVLMEDTKHHAELLQLILEIGK